MGPALEHLLNSVSEPFALIDTDGRVLRANLAYRRLTGPAGGAHDASILSFLESDRQEAGGDLLRSLCAENPERSQQMRFKIGRSLHLIDAKFNWIGPDGLLAFVGLDVTEKDARERERIESNTDRDTLEQIGEIGHWRVGKDMRLRCSAGAARVLSMDPSAPPMLLSEFAEQIVAEERSGATAAARHAFERRRPVNFTYRYRRPDGDIRTLQVCGAPSIELTGRIECYHGVLIDKTDALAALREAVSEDSTLHQVIDAAPMAVSMLDRDLRILLGSKTFFSQHGISPETAIGRPISEVLPDVSERWRTAHRQALRGESTHNDCDGVETRDGARAWLRWSCAPWRRAGGEIGGVLMLSEDISSIMDERFTVEASKERMDFGLSMSSIMILELDFERRQIHLEGDWKQLFPAKPNFDAITGAETYIHADDREHLADKWRAHLSGGPAYSVEYRVEFPEGQTVWHHADIRILKTVKGSPARAFAVVHDVTERKQAESAALEAEHKAVAAGAAKADFLSNMSHEIRTPLNGVLAVSEMLARTHLDDKQSEMVRLITNSGETLLKVMDDLVEYSRLESDQITFDVRPFDLESAIQQACEAAQTRAESKGLIFDQFISANLDGVFRGDPLRLQQVLGNLLNNAVKFTDQGRISLTATAEESNGRTMVRIQIQDTGIGMTEEVSSRIFERFMQADESDSRKYGGLGLGLSIVKRLVDLMGGDVTVVSRPGEGSTFELLLPLSRDRISALGAINAVAVEDFVAETTVEDVRLLVAEDNPMNRRVVELLLAQSDIQLTFAENGQEALDLFQNGVFDLVLMDLQMPIMSGLAATRAIREWETANGRARTPILALSANATDEHVEEAREAGADGHVAKPIVREVLFEAIARHARKSEGAPAHDDLEFDLDDLDVAI
ncbi:MAG: ATP-binding protein [Hyphomonadaceae bacterium]